MNMNLPVIWEDKRERSELIPNGCNLGDPYLDEPLATAVPGERKSKGPEIGFTSQFS